jgi:hypothetical protein
MGKGFKIRHDGMDRFFNHLFALAGMRPRRVEARDPQEQVMDGPGTWTKCGMCGDTTKPLDADSLCPDCASDMAVDETERND